MALVEQYYTHKILTHGASHQGVDWNSKTSQELRFEQLLKILPGPEPFSVIDWGCGYGYLFEYLKRKGKRFQYRGYDVSRAMIHKAREIYGPQAGARFYHGFPKGSRADYAFASGIFNVKLKATPRSWEKHILKTLDEMDQLSRRGFSFNCLTKYSDPGRMRTDLYYADPLFLFDYCKMKFSKNVALLHDYGLYEFTLLVRKRV